MFRHLFATDAEPRTGTSTDHCPVNHANREARGRDVSMPQAQPMDWKSRGLGSTKAERRRFITHVGRSFYETGIRAYA